MGTPFFPGAPLPPNPLQSLPRLACRGTLWQTARPDHPARAAHMRLPSEKQGVANSHHPKLSTSIPDFTHA